MLFLSSGRFVSVDQVLSSVVGGRKHPKESVQAALHVGRGVPHKEAVFAGRQGQLSGPGLAHQAAPAHRQLQHPHQPQVFQAGVYAQTPAGESAELTGAFWLHKILVLTGSALLQNRGSSVAFMPRLLEP